MMVRGPDQGGRNRAGGFQERNIAKPTFTQIGAESAKTQIWTVAGTLRLPNFGRSFMAQERLWERFG